jgi:cytochrome b6-f complex iron-sulfur subunit
LLVHDPKAGFLALYNRDPFRGCRIAWMSITRRFVDPCHGSEYTQVGEHLRGPAPRDLDRFAVIVTAGGDVVVDVSAYHAARNR